MKLEKYRLRADPDQKAFEFTSVGRLGSVLKGIYFQQSAEQDLFNLAFGDIDPATGEMDDLAITNNGDTEKVLSTVVAALYVFFRSHPNASVYATRSTKARTRLYRMGITKFHREMRLDFYLLGFTGVHFETFEIGEDYEGFLVQKKIRNLP